MALSNRACCLAQLKHSNLMAEAIPGIFYYGVFGRHAAATTQAKCSIIWFQTFW